MVGSGRGNVTVWRKHGLDMPGFESYLCHLLVMGPQTTYLLLEPPFPNVRMDIEIPTWQGYCEN